jgi:PIN domain nuclease of toxin-antitoxin system
MIILDTHIWLNWVIQGETGIPPDIAAALRSEPRVAVSAISSFEVVYLHKRKRIELPLPVREWLKEALAPSRIESLPVTSEIATASAELPEHHKDPADRIIIATTLAHDAKLASVDSVFPLYEALQGRLLAT